MKTVKASELDRMFDDDEDISAYMDVEHAERLGGLAKDGDGQKTAAPRLERLESKDS